MQRPALPGHSTQNTHRPSWQRFSARADTLAAERVVPRGQLWMEAVANQDRVLRLLNKPAHASQSVPDGAPEHDGPVEPWILKQNMVSLNPIEMHEIDVLVSFGSRSADIINKLTRTDRVSVSMEGTGFFQQLLRDVDQRSVHARFPILIISIDVMEADTRGLGVPVALSIDSEYTQASHVQYRNWCQGKTLTLCASSTAPVSSSRGEVAHHAAAAPGGRTVTYTSHESTRCSPLDGATVFGADAHYTTVRTVYIAPLDVLVFPGVRSLLSIDFARAHQQFQRTFRNNTYNVVIGSSDDVTPISESAWLALHMLHLARSSEESKGIASDVDLFQSTHSGSLKQLSLPAAETDDHLRELESECKPYELCLEANQGFRFSLSTLANQWRAVPGAAVVSPSVLVRVTYAIVPCSEQSVNNAAVQ